MIRIPFPSLSISFSYANGNKHWTSPEKFNDELYESDRVRVVMHLVLIAQGLGKIENITTLVKT
jgi:hypothetical protein